MVRQWAVTALSPKSPCNMRVVFSGAAGEQQDVLLRASAAVLEEEAAGRGRPPVRVGRYSHTLRTLHHAERLVKK